MLSLPNDVLDSALTLLVSGITSFDDESPGESTPLAQLSQKARTLDFIMQAFHSHIQKRILPVRRQFNKLLPISKLPDELLQEIFLYACVASDGLARYRTPTILAAVSSRWRSVAIWYPQLWNSMHSDLGVEFTKLMLQRSKSAPVDLFCSCSSKDRANRFFDLLIPQSMRWRTLEFSYSNFAKLSLDFLAGQSFPLLERVILPQHERGPFYGIIHHLNLNIVAPSIKVFEAPKHPLCLHLDHSIPSMLTTLSFTASINSVPFLPSDYYKLLTSTPYLQHLFIRGFLNAVSPDPDVTEPMRIDLPHLNTLKLESLRYKTIGFLLSSIVTLPNGYPDVEVRDKLFGSLSTMFSLSPQEDSLLAGFSHSNQAVLMSLGASVGVSLELEAADGKKTLLNLIPHESASPVEDLSIIVTVLLPVIRQLEIDGLEILWLGLVDKLHLLPRLEKSESAQKRGITITQIARMHWCEQSL
ncbi:hypothetical protein FRC02_009606 [Tulasnella sp. 418]|nr:hypothetical protein FRC02_009606 [Tulasnella sp. 418]